MPRSVIFLILFCLTAVSFSRERIRPEYDFRDSSFSLTFRIDIPQELSSEQVLAILFNYHYVKQYSAKTNVNITLLEETESTNRILYEYNYLVARLGVEMFREKFPEKKKVIFRMISYNRSARIIPDVISAGGTYQIIDNGRTLLYTQETVMDQRIGGVYRMLIRRDVQAYLREVMNFLDEYAASLR